MRAAGSQTLLGAWSKPFLLCSGSSCEGTPAPKKPATDIGVMFSQTNHSPSRPFSPFTVCGARSRNFLSSRSAHIVGGSTKCESAEINLYSAMTCSSLSSAKIVECRFDCNTLTFISQAGTAAPDPYSSVQTAG